MLRRLHERYFLRFEIQEVANIARQLTYVAGLSFARESVSVGDTTAPLVFINGAADRFTPPQAARPLAAHFADARFAVVADAGHFLAMEGAEALPAGDPADRGLL